MKVTIVDELHKNIKNFYELNKDKLPEKTLDEFINSLLTKGYNGLVYPKITLSKTSKEIPIILKDKSKPKSKNKLDNMYGEDDE